MRQASSVLVAYNQKNDKDDKSRGNWHTRSLVCHRLRKQARRVGIVAGVARAAHAGAWMLVRSPEAGGIWCVSSTTYRFPNGRIILPAVYTRSLARCICRSVPIHRCLLSDTITLWISTFSHLWRWNPSPIRWWGRLFTNSIAGRSFWIGGGLALCRGSIIVATVMAISVGVHNYLKWLSKSIQNNLFINI